MPDPLPDYKRRARESRRAALLEEYEAASAQLSRELSDVNRKRLERQIADLEGQIAELERQMAELGAERGDAPGAQPSPPRREPVQGIPADLSRPLREVLLQCPQFADAQALRALLSHAWLMPWRDSVPMANNPRTQVDLLLSHLADRYRATGENALVLFLQVLAMEADADTRLHDQLLDLAAQLAAAKGQLAGIAPLTDGPSAKAASDDDAEEPAASFGGGNRWAVLVGVNQYTDPYYPLLHVCAKDAAAFHGALAGAGYDPARMRLLTDTTDFLPTRAKILSAAMQMAKAAARDDLLLFYYSGHGDVVGSSSYLVARDGEAHALAYTGVALAEIAEILAGSEARARVIILDACHSGANFAGKGPKSMPPGFVARVFEQAKGQVVLASCEQGEFSYEWEAQERSVFTHFLLEALEGRADFDGKGFVTVQDANRYVSDGVRKWAFQNGKSQTPTLEGKVAGDIVLVELA